VNPIAIGCEVRENADADSPDSYQDWEGEIRRPGAFCA